ncbi:MAG: MBL fold metallo-hydrolase [Citrobacter freundii]|nr:MAG: MBL fold metallo-hydrolase [Citrobacter freundii]
MSLFISSLNSGSNGNCYYVGNEEEAVLIDAGISCREIEKRMKRLELSIDKVKAVFISHEHGDHITGVVSLSRKYKLPVYITPKTLADSKLPVDEAFVNSFTADQPVIIGNLMITAFRKYHDAIDPHSFVISSNNVQIGVFTDIGVCCSEVKKYFAQCDAVFLESNYCNDMLENGRYPYHLKRRIKGGKGHLSNTEALELFCQYRTERLKYLILSHLSNNNNDTELVSRIFNEKAGDTNIIVASRYQETEVIRIDPFTGVITSQISATITPRIEIFRAEDIRPVQLTLFE